MVPRRIAAALAAMAGVAALATGAANAQGPEDPPPLPGAPEPQRFRANDAGGFRNILPPGQRGRANAADVLAFENDGTRPRHSSDQLGMYADLLYNAPGLEISRISHFFKDASFGARSDNVERRYTPRADVTIVRDRDFGVPHIYGRDRRGTMFGAGYAGAEDRLFMMDVLRNVGRARLSSFVGGSPANRKLDHEQWQVAPYREADLTRQAQQFEALYGAQGKQIREDVENYVEGINKYIVEAKADARKMPAEYAAIGRPQGPEPWRIEDLVATAALVGGIFGRGGGRELDSAEVLLQATKRFGSRRGKRVWKDFRSAEDREAPVTVRGKRFPYQTPPRRVARGSRAIPDRGSVRDEKIAQPGPGTPDADDDPTFGPLPVLPGLPNVPGMSNALVVSARESSTGHPLAVFGPQVGYFSPQILMEVDLHAPSTATRQGIDARGAAFAGVNLYVQLGRGRDYTWSATSAGQDNTDTFAVDLCNPDGSRATTASRHYLHHGRCLAMDELERRNCWNPNAADDTPPGCETLRVFRTRLGIVYARGRVGGKPVAYTRLRSTYMHEVDSARGFVDFNDPRRMESAEEFQRAAHKIGYTFNWFYADERKVAYYNSGNNPVRARGLDHNFPVRARKRFEWRNWNPSKWTASYTPFSQHPRTIDQSYLTSWNNKLARGYRAADDQWQFTPVHRSEPLDDRIRGQIRGRRQMGLTDLVNAAEDAASVDLRGDKVLPWMLRAVGTPRTPAQRSAVRALRRWERAGAHRRDKDRSGTYEHSRAIQIMDAWWPRAMRAQFEPVLGRGLYRGIQGMNLLDDAPNSRGAHVGSAYHSGWYGYAEKDLRSVLGRRVSSRYSREYCGRGSLGRCRYALRRALSAALKVPRSELYRDPVCEKEGGRMDAQKCFDAIRFAPLGAITQPLIDWQNRPTFQQVVTVRRNRP